MVLTMIRADLHMHTRVSDGADEIETVIDTCIQKKLTHIAVTNHDDMDGFDRTKELCDKAGIKTVKSIEITTYDRSTGHKAHILGYDIQNEEPIRKLTDPLLKRRHENALKQIEILKREGYEIDVKELKSRVYKIIYKQNLLQYLVEKGYADRIYGDFYRTYFSKGGICSFRPEDIDTVSAVRAIKESGGLAVLAHAGQQENYELIETLYPIGLDGVELYHASNDEKARKLIREASEGKNLFFTGGSDYHGAYSRRKVEIGDYLAEEGAVQAIFERR